jgi:hypothetical protein
MVGIWDYKQQRSRLTVKIEAFAPLADNVKQGIEAEALRLGAFFESIAEIGFS